jgi:hypothetical protein
LKNKWIGWKYQICWWFKSKSIATQIFEMNQAKFLNPIVFN